MTDPIPIQQPQQQKAFCFSKLAREQDDLPTPEALKDIISSKAHGATNVDKLEAQEPVIFILSISPENKVSITFGHSAHTKSKSSSKALS